MTPRREGSRIRAFSTPILCRRPRDDDAQAAVGGQHAKRTGIIVKGRAKKTGIIVDTQHAKRTGIIVDTPSRGQ